MSQDPTALSLHDRHEGSQTLLSEVKIPFCSSGLGKSSACSSPSPLPLAPVTVPPHPPNPLSLCLEKRMCHCAELEPEFRSQFRCCLQAWESWSGSFTPQCLCFLICNRGPDHGRHSPVRMLLLCPALCTCAKSLQSCPTLLPYGP